MVPLTLSVYIFMSLFVMLYVFMCLKISVPYENFDNFIFIISSALLKFSPSLEILRIQDSWEIFGELLSI